MTSETAIEDDEAGLRRGDIASILEDEAAARPPSDALLGRARGLAGRIADEEARRAGGPELASGDAPLPAGHLLGHWRIEALVGEGGQGRVYRARSVKFLREAALKIPRSAFAGRLLKEARLASRLKHVRIVRVQDVVVESAPPYLVLEWCPGGSLAERLAASGGEGLPLADVGRIADELLEGLEAAHAEGIVHCDVKPANVLFDVEGGATLTDLGIGRAPVDEAARLLNSAAATGAHTAVVGAGTPLYLAPEQERPALLQGAPIDGRTDLFALGKVIFEMLTGASPRTVRPPSRLRKGLDPRWDEFVFRLLEEKREARFASAQDARRALHVLAPRTLLRPTPRRKVAEPQAARVAGGLAGRAAAPAGRGVALWVMFTTLCLFAFGIAASRPTLHVERSAGLSHETATGDVAVLGTIGIFALGGALVGVVAVASRFAANRRARLHEQAASAATPPPEGGVPPPLPNLWTRFTAIAGGFVAIGGAVAGGYVLAVGAAVAGILALIGRGCDGDAALDRTVSLAAVSGVVLVAVAAVSGVAAFVWGVAGVKRLVSHARAQRATRARDGAAPPDGRT